MTEEEIEKINDLVQKSLTLSYYYSDEQSLYEFEDADFEIRNYVIPDGSPFEGQLELPDSK